MYALQFQNVNYQNEGKSIIKELSLDVEQGDYVTIVGPSGGGKSTFLKLCCHLITPTGGCILYRGKNVLDYNPMELRKCIAYCFQMPYLFGNTVMDNMAYPYTLRGRKVDRERIHELFSLLKMDIEFLSKDIKNLSGGEKQRIALIRTLLFKPDILLLDEITSALDADNTRIVENAITTFNEHGVTILWITHSMEQSRKYAKKILTLENGAKKSLEVLR